MKKIHLLVLMAILMTTLSGCGSGTYTIKDEEFKASDICDGTGTFEIVSENGSVQAKVLGDVKSHMLKSGMPGIWCHGFIHQFTGTVKVNGYTFVSDASDPLKFTVDRKKGYYYTSGKGTITDPKGKVTNLP